MENPIQMDDLGVFSYFWKHPYEDIYEDLQRFIDYETLSRIWKRDY